MYFQCCWDHRNFLVTLTADNNVENNPDCEKCCWGCRKVQNNFDQGQSWLLLEEIRVCPSVEFMSCWDQEEKKFLERGVGVLQRIDSVFSQLGAESLKKKKL